MPLGRLPLASCTRQIAAWRRTTRKLSGGSAVRPTRAMPAASTTSVPVTATVAVWCRTTRKLSGGIAVRLTKATHSRRETLGSCTARVAGFLGTMGKRSAGFAARPNRATPSGRPNSAGCTRTVGACGGTAWKPSCGTVAQRTGATLGHKSNSIVFGEPKWCTAQRMRGARHAGGWSLPAWMTRSRREGSDKRRSVNFGSPPNLAPGRAVGGGAGARQRVAARGRRHFDHRPLRAMKCLGYNRETMHGMGAVRAFAVAVLATGAFPISRSRAHTHRRHGHPLQTVPSAGLIERPQEKNRVDALR